MKNKSRNLLLAVFLLLAFIGGGVVFYSVWVVQKPFAVILFLVPQLDSSHLAAARMFSTDPQPGLDMESMPGLFLLRSPVAGPSRGGVEISRILALAGAAEARSQQPGGQAESLLQQAVRQGRITGLVTNGRITSPSLSAFHSPAMDATDAQSLSLALIESVRPEVVLGGGADTLLPDLKGGVRVDGRDLLLEARQGGYDIVRNLPELRNTPTWRLPRVFGVFAQQEMRAGESVETAGQPTLSDMVASAIQLLQFQRRGYFLVVDGARIASAAAENAGEDLLRELLAVDEAIQTARQYAGKNSLIIVAGTSSSGGFVLNAPASPRDKGLAVLSPSASGVPAITWSTGPGKPGSTPGLEEPVAFQTPTAVPNVTDMLGFWSGPEKATPPTGIHDMSFVSELIRQAL